MGKNEWARMTWVEIREALRDDPVVLIPLGSVEQHGPHTPVGDYLATEVVAQRTAERTGALYVPTVPYGYSETHRGFAGTLTLRPATLLATLEDLTASLTDAGAERLLFLCGHGGNVPIIEHHARDLLRTRGLRTACIDLWRLLTPDFYRRLYAQPAPLTGHGSEPIGSVMAYVAPGSTRPDLVAPASRAEFAGLPAQGSQVLLDGVSFYVYPRALDTSDIGVIGDPSLGTPERGEAIIAHVVDICCRVVEWFGKLDTTVSS